MTFMKGMKDPAAALRNTTFIAAILFWAGGYLAIDMFDLNVESDVMQAVILGSVVGILIGLVTEYYTGIEPVMGIKHQLFLTLERCQRQAQQQTQSQVCLSE